MPRIQEYTQQVEAPGAVGGTSPNLEAVGASGRGLQQLGSNVEQISRVVYERQRSAETSDVYATMAEKRAQLMEDVNDQVSKGTFDADQFKEKYQEWAEKQSDQYQTPDGKNYFNRQASRLQGTLLVKAARGQAVQQANDAKAKFTDGLNAYGATVEGDPSQFQDAFDANMEHLNQLVGQGVVPAKDAPKFREAMGIQLAQSALRGYMQQDPDQAEAALKSGQFDQFLNAPQRRQMETEIRTAQHASEIEGMRQENIAKKAQAAQAEQWGQQAMNKLENNSLSPKEVLAAPLTVEQKHQWLGWIKSQARMQTVTDPTILNDLQRRVLLPSNDPQYIGDISQVLNAPGVSAQDTKKITQWFAKTPQGQADNANRKSLIDVARAKLVSANPMMGIKDPDGQFQLAQFTNALQVAEQQQRDAGKPISDLHNPNSKDYFGHRISQFVKTPQQILADSAALMRGDRTAPAATIHTTPGVVPAPAEKLADGEVARTTKDGRTAVYDSKTKAFKRWKK